MAQEGTSKLVFHFEVSDGDADLEAIKTAIDQELASVKSVEDVKSEVVTEERLIDPVSIGAMIVTVTVAVKGTQALVEAIDGLIESVKKLGTTLGVTAWLESRRKRVEVDETADARALAENIAAAAPPSA